MSDLRQDVLQAAQAAKAASAQLRVVSGSRRAAAVLAIADAVLRNSDTILEANSKDVERAVARGIDSAIIDRLTLSPQRLQDIADAARAVATLPDPVGETMSDYTVANGLRIQQIRVPLGVVAMVYEARPNVTVDAAVLCLKSGNVALLRGSSSAMFTNEVLTDVMRASLAELALPTDAIVLVPGASHDSVDVLKTARGLVDVIIPRGGAGLIESVVRGSHVPVIETGVGNCHVYIDAAADIEKAVAIAVNAKSQRVSVCNAAETLLIHADIAQELLPKLLAEFRVRGVTVHGTPAIVEACDQLDVQAVLATDADWAAEYYSLDIAVGIVASLEEAITHISRWSTGHTEAIVTESADAVEQFVAAIDSAAVIVNASTRFTDGGEFGFGAEIGISTQKLHARGPMGLRELTSYKYVVTGSGQIRS